MFSLEMPKRELSLRLLAQRTGIGMHALRGGEVTADHQWAALSREIGAAQQQRLFIDDRGGIGLAYVRARAKRVARKSGLGLIVIDYIGLMKGDDSRQNRNQELGAISRGLKALAKELCVPVIACAQLNRAVENRPDKRPHLHDLRDSGEIEQDADIVMMLHREEATNDAPEWRGVGELLVRKNRNGPTGDVRLSFDAQAVRFGNHAGPDPRALQNVSSKPGTRGRGFNYSQPDD